MGHEKICPFLESFIRFIKRSRQQVCEISYEQPAWLCNETQKCLNSTMVLSECAIKYTIVLNCEVSMILQFETILVRLAAKKNQLLLVNQSHIKILLHNVKSLIYL